MNGDTNIALIEPMHPDRRLTLEDAVVDLIAESAALAEQIPPILRASIGELVRRMGSYYSNLIEGHALDLMSIEQAMIGEYSSDLRRRDLQMETRAHVEVQTMIDRGLMPHSAMSAAGIRWLHREFCSRLPDEMLVVSGGGMSLTMVPGELRSGYVKVGRHEAPAPEDIPALLRRFEEAYGGRMISRSQKIMGVGAAHHRLAHIHPFFDGNGRVARLQSHAMHRELGIRTDLWSLSRGLASHVSEYRELLAVADRVRQGDRDGRGHLSEEGLFRFTDFFLRTALEEIRFMRSLLHPKDLLVRIEIWTSEEVRAKRLPRGSFVLLREAVLVGEFSRGAAVELTGYRERQARSVMTALIERGLLVSDGSRGPLRLGIPADVVERWLPTLYRPSPQPALVEDDRRSTTVMGR